MKAFSVYLFTAFLAVSVQSTLLNNVIRPDFLLILVCFYSLRHGQARGTVYGVLTGLLVDSASGFILGPNILTKALAGFFIGAIRQKMFQWNAFISAAIIGFFSLADIFLVYISLETFADLSFFNRPLRISIMQVIYTTALSLFLFPFLNPQESGRAFPGIKGSTF